MLWFNGSVTAAITAAKQRNALFVVYVRGDDDISAQMDATWEDGEVSKICQDSRMVAIKFDAKSEECKQFSQFYPVMCVPCVSFISGETGIPLEGTVGHLSPADFKQRIQKVLEVSKQESSASTSQATDGISGGSQPPPAATSPPLVPQPSSAAPPQVPQPSTTSQIPQTQEPKKELSKLEKAARLRQKMEEIHQRKEAQKEEEIRKKEIDRRKVGQSVQQSMKERSDQEARRVAEELRKEKEEDRLAKERVRQQIARDRAEKQSRYSADKKEREKAQAVAKESAAQAASEPPKRKINMDVARIQFRLPDGSTLTQQFQASAPLQEAMQFLQENVGRSLQEFTMSTTFPRRCFTGVDMNSTFLELDLVPTAALIVLPGRYKGNPGSSSASSSAVKPASSGGIIAMLLAPLLLLWNFIVSLIFGKPRETQAGGAASEPVASQVPVKETVPPAQSAMGARPKSAQVRRRQSPRGEGTSRQEGNIHRLVTAQDDEDDDNNTWNGNSTQQM